MKNIKLVLLALICFTLLSFTLNQTSIFQENLEDVGIIKQSLLKPNQFNKTQKGTWVLLNGQIVSKDSELYKLLEENFDLNILTKKDGKYFLPNASGAFIRSSNINGEGGDPDKDRIVGSVQKDALKKHKHPLQNTIYKHGRSFKGESDKDHTLKHCCGTVWVSETKVVGDDIESRPLNVSMYTYIKISN